MQYQFLTYLIQVLVGILGANVEGAAEAIFTTHALNMWSFLLCLAVFCIAWATGRCRIIAITSGSLSAISLVTTFLQRSIGLSILYVSWACAVVIVVCHQYGSFFMRAALPLYLDTLEPIFRDIWNWFEASCLPLYHDILGPNFTDIWNWYEASCLQLYHGTLEPNFTHIWNWFEASCLQLYHDTLKPFSAYIWNRFRASCLQLYRDNLKPFSAYIWNQFRASCLRLYYDTWKPFSTYIGNWFRAKESIFSTGQQGPQAEV